MIQHTHLTAWQTHAPWPRRSQIEQDLQLSRGVAAIFADSVLGELVQPPGLLRQESQLQEQVRSRFGYMADFSVDLHGLPFLALTMAR